MKNFEKFRLCNYEISLTLADLRARLKDLTRRTLLWAVPLSVVVSCIIILLATCYPSVVFYWGDEVKRYASVLDRRKAIWSIIIAVTVVGVSSRFLFENVSSWLPH